MNNSYDLLPKYGNWERRLIIASPFLTMPNSEAMTKKQTQHLNRIVKETTKRLRKKYIAGAKEHHGNIWDIDCLQEAFDEILDLIVYVQTEIHKRELKKSYKRIVERSKTKLS
jgi:hypothetical protein